MLTMPEPRAGRAGRRPARDAGEGRAARRRCSSTRRCATSRSSPRSACRSGRAGSACAAPPRTTPGELDVPVDRRRRDDPPRRRRRARRRRRRRRRGRARRGGARRRRSAREEKERVKREKLAGGRALLRPRRPARDRRGRGAMSEIAHLGPVELLTPDGERQPARSSPTCWGWRSRRAGRAVGLPARLGRLPALQPEADRVRHLGDGRARPARVEPGGARAPRRRRRGDRARRGLDRRRRGRGPSYRFRDPDGHRLRALLRGRALRRRPSTCGRR